MNTYGVRVSENGLREVIKEEHNAKMERGNKFRIGHSTDLEIITISGVWASNKDFLISNRARI